VHQLGTAPYLPAVTEAMTIPSQELGLALPPQTPVYLPPNIAGYVGADHVSVWVATEMARETRTVIALDIGTNTEIGLVHAGRYYCCSCASGPAFEGAHIRDGMRAAPGAIERVQITDHTIHIHTISNQPAVGICGSGILDVVAELLAAQAIDETGNFKIDHPLVRTPLKSRRECLLVQAENTGHGRDIIVNRKDVNEIQLAKSAIRTGTELLLHDAGIGDDDIDEFIIAGAFGTYLDLESAIRVGMFPNLPRERFKQVGNAAGAGARQMLVLTERRRMAEDIALRVNYVELTTHPKFTETFIKQLMF
jgi:uncharacterized 2Fe-2S/4Fe-4S cluster protein (DUF4445 family)